MTESNLYTFFSSWVRTVVGAGVPVILGYQNSPAPSERPYIVIEYGAWEKVGTASHQVADTSEVNPRRYDYRVPQVVWQVGGQGELLREIDEALETQDALDVFGAASVSVLISGSNNYVPRNIDDTWENEYRKEMRLLVSRAVQGDNNYIETVEITNEIGG